MKSLNNPFVEYGYKCPGMYRPFCINFTSCRRSL